MIMGAREHIIGICIKWLSSIFWICALTVVRSPKERTKWWRRESISNLIVAWTVAWYMYVMLVCTSLWMAQDSVIWVWMCYCFHWKISCLWVIYGFFPLSCWLLKTRCRTIICFHCRIRCLWVILGLFSLPCCLLKSTNWSLWSTNFLFLDLDASWFYSLVLLLCSYKKLIV